MAEHNKEGKKSQGIMEKIINKIFTKTTDIKKLKTRSEKELKKAGQ